MLSRMPAGHMITTHSFVALVRGSINVGHLRDALRWTWKASALSEEELVGRALTVTQVDQALGEAWQRSFEVSLDASRFDFDNGPLWRLEAISDGKGQNALHFSFVHSLDDQRSANAMVHELLTYLEQAAGGHAPADPAPMALPQSIEGVVLAKDLDPLRLLGYAMSQLSHGSEPNVKVPSSLRSKERPPKKNWGLDPTQPHAHDRPVEVPVASADGIHKHFFDKRIDPETDLAAGRRKNIVAPRELGAESLAALRRKCRENNVTIGMAFAAAALLAASDVGNDESDFGYESYRLLLGVDLRRFGPEGDWTNGTVAFASGALDFVLRLLPKSGSTYAAEVAGNHTHSLIGGVPFWDLARASADFTQKWFEKGYAEESTRLFDIGTRYLQLERIITTTAEDPTRLGREYTVTVSNAGVFAHGAADGSYGGLTLQGIYFGISQAVSGSMLAASGLTVAGKLHITAHAATPIISRGALDSFADSMVRTLELAATAPIPRRSGVPRVDYPTEVRGGLPWFYPLETPKGELRCPTYEDIRSPTLPAFDIDKYVGIWYELAFHDITQANVCGCTRFNMTRYGTVIEDMFTVTCPWPWQSGVDGPWLPGYSEVSGKRKLNQWTCNMTMYFQPARLGVMRETGFGLEFDNMVLEIWQDPDLQRETGYEYTRAIQFQCVSTPPQNEITFTGINFLSRVPIVSPSMLQEMFIRAQALGLEPYGSNDMHIIEHRGCDYPTSTDVVWMGERPEWPCPIFDRELGAQV